MSMIWVAIVESWWSKPTLFESNPSQDFIGAMKAFKEASHTFFKMKRDNKIRKQFFLESGKIAILEDLWGQGVLICVFEAWLSPIQQKNSFRKLKNVVMQPKSMVNLMKKSNEIKLAIIDIMTGLNGMDRLSMKLTDTKQINFEEYRQEHLSLSSSSRTQLNYQKSNGVRLR